MRAPVGAELGTLSANGWHVPLCELDGGAAVSGIGSVIHRTFVPQFGLHPQLAAHDPLVLEWARGGECVRVELYAWKPGGGPYPGLPGDDAEARARRDARVIVRQIEASALKPSRVKGLAMDLRRQY